MTDDNASTNKMPAIKKREVKYANEFNLTNLQALERIEMDLFFAILSVLAKEKVLSIEIPFDVLNRAAEIYSRKYSKARQKNFFENLGNKLTDLKAVALTGDKNKEEKKNGKIIFMPLWSKFIIDFDRDVVVANLNPEFANYFFDIELGRGFSQFELAEFITLKSKYSKTLFRQFIQMFRGEWTVKIDQLREILNIPESYSNRQIVSLLKKCIVEIEQTKYISNINMEVFYEKTRGVPIKEIYFSFEVTRGIPKNYSIKYLTKEIETNEVKEIFENQDGLPVPKVIMQKNIEHEKTLCPICKKGHVVIINTASGKKYKTCSNGKYFLDKKGNCEFFEWIQK